MPKATWNGAIIAESESTEIIEGNHYFPMDSVHKGLLRESDTHTVCHWKGTASYYSLVVNGEVNEDAAWCYPAPKPAAAEIAGHVAFWKGVEVEA